MKPKTNRSLRQFHHYLGVFFAPAIVFFALTGVLQTFGFHEAKDGAKPAAWIVWTASIHKDQVVPRVRPPRNAPVNGDAHGDAHDDAHNDAHDHAPEHASGAAADPGPKHSAFPLKVFVGLMGIGLIASSLLGVAIALSIWSMRRVSLVMLALGTLLPMALLLI
jgi:hypothetical protein